MAITFFAQVTRTDKIHHRFLRKICVLMVYFVTPPEFCGGLVEFDGFATVLCWQSLILLKFILSKYIQYATQIASIYLPQPGNQIQKLLSLKGRDAPEFGASYCTEKKKKESLVTKPSLLKESLILPE